MTAGMSDEKRRILELSRNFLCPGRVKTFCDGGIDLVIGRREGYRLTDLDGHELIDLHLNGGVFSLGHRNPEVLEALHEALETLDIGNHHFPSVARAEFAQDLSARTPGDLRYSVFAPSGGEAAEVAIKTARYATGRRKIVSLHKGYHGCTGLTLPAGDARFSKIFLSEDRAGEFVKVAFNDLEAMRAALRDSDVAAVILETIPATLGFPMPEEGYLKEVAALCREFGTLYIADEVQTGLGRTGHLWGVERFGVEPDILVAGKGLSGGLYPVAVAVLGAKLAGWLEEDGFAHVSTFGGAEIGCRIGQKVLEISARPEVLANVRSTSERLDAGLRDIQGRHPFLQEIRRCGVVMGLRFDHEAGGLLAMKALYDCGIWAIYAGFDASVLQFKPGLLWDDALCDEVLDRFERAMKSCPGGAV